MHVLTPQITPGCTKILQPTLTFDDANTLQDIYF